MTESWTVYQSPLGPLTLVGSDAGLRHVFYPDLAPRLEPDRRDADAFFATTTQFDRYFAGDTKTIDAPLDLCGTDFQRATWTLLTTIPYGQTTTYRDLALRLAEVAPDMAPTTSALTRAVAWAIAKTPVPIVIPCHRVIGADGSMKGYLGGIPRKEALLRFEAADEHPPALADRWAPIGGQQRLALT